ncbi:MAG: tRNA (N6-isopentenyl adenosine(37)-C2)-methylthiotransferase MiaB [Deltaproteobacteria bacterium]|nr:tRNA (N6-isopentenyl adenosine(37)-C2)-methylthiotransferase MiaB [Deltaproteobacteria bacterium]
MDQRGINLLNRHEPGPTRRYVVRTFGCQMNEHDSLTIRGLLAQHAYLPATTLDEADLIIFNTCTIREKAHHKAFSEIGRTAQLKEERPHVVVGVCGCVAQQDREGLFQRFPHLDLLFGPDQIQELPRLLDQLHNGESHVSALQCINSADDYHFLDLIPWATAVEQGRPTAPPATAFVTIMKGCDANCAYCIVPSVRGKEVCRPAEAIVSEVAALAVRGVREVTLLGQTVNTYGNRRHPGVIPFPDLLQRLADETTIARIRFTSPHPKDVNAALAGAYRDNPKLVPHIHMPLQAGSDAVLRRMRRSYSRQQYLDKVALLRAASPDLALTTDLIVGFPGETEADFLQTCGVVRDVGFSGIYAFKYSPRPGTSAAEALHDDVTEREKRDRLDRLLTMHNAMLQRQLAANVGTMQEVLIERYDEGSAQWTGRTPHNTLVHCTGASLAIGQLAIIHITRAYGHSLEGKEREVIRRELAGGGGV